MQHGHFFSVSGLRSTGRSTLYANLAKHAPEYFPDQRFAFIGNPFGSLPHPLLAEEMSRTLDPTTRLMQLWSVMNQFMVEKLLPALADDAIAISDGFELDAFLYAISGVYGKEFERVASLHHGLIDLRLREQSIRSPQYLLVHASDACVMNWATTSSELLAQTNPVMLRKHVAHERLAIQHYFGERHMQKPTIPLDAEHVSHAELCIEAINAIAVAMSGETARPALQVA